MLPDLACTPGATSRGVAQSNIQQTICMPGYTQSVRPPTDYTDKVKDERLVAYGQNPRDRSHYELDHLIPLELGGDPKDIKNLWPEPEPGYHQKDAIENDLNHLVCSGKIQLADAQQRIVKDWRKALP